MAYYSESGYCAEEEMNRRPGYYGEGGERYAVRKEYEEIDEVERARRGHGHHHHHHHAPAGGHEGCHGEHFGGGGGYRREHEHGHGHGGHGYGSGRRPYDACESKYYD